MDLNHSFEVDASIEDTWATLIDLERIAPCLPGAELKEIEGDEHRGVVKVKVGPMTAQYQGTATFVERDEGARRAVLTASGRETRGQGNASAVITAALEPAGSGTRVDIHTDLTITGRVAQFGRGVLDDVSDKILGQFVENLERDVLSGSGAPSAEAGVEHEPDDEPGVESPRGDTGPRQVVQSGKAAPIDLVGVGGMPVAKRLAPVAALVLVLLLVRWLRGRD